MSRLSKKWSLKIYSVSGATLFSNEVALNAGFIVVTGTADDNNNDYAHSMDMECNNTDLPVQQWWTWGD